MNKDNNNLIMGIKRGSVNRITGRGGAGSTTLALSLVSILLDKYENSVAKIFDQEQSISLDRLTKIASVSSEIPQKDITLINNVHEMFITRYIKYSVENNSSDEGLNIVMIDSLPICRSLAGEEYLKMLENDIKDTNIIIIFTDYQICKLVTINDSLELCYETNNSHIFNNEILLTPLGKNNTKLTMKDMEAVLTRDKDYLFDKEQLAKII